MRRLICFYVSRFLLVFFLWSVFVNAEPSAFELQSGATKKELKTLQSSSKNLESVITDLQNRIYSLEQISDGLKSLFEGQVLKLKGLSDTALSHQNLIKTIQTLQDSYSNMLKEQAQLIESLKTQAQKNEKALQSLDKKVADLSNLFNRFNTDVLRQLSTFKKSLGVQSSDLTDIKKNTDKKNSDSKEVSNASKEISFIKDISKQKEIFQEAKIFYSQKKNLEAKKRFEWLVETNYRVGYASYLLGEIAYRQKKYSEAIALYKKSALIDDKASYMPILLWHTAWSFKYSKDLPNYNKFLDSLIYLYPNSEQGQKAKEIRNKTKDKK